MTAITAARTSGVAGLRTPERAVLLLMVTIAFVLAVVTVLFPPHPDTPTHLSLAAIAILVPLGLLIVALPNRWSTVLIHVTLGFVVVAATLVMVNAATGPGALAVSHAYVWVGIYAAMFRARGTARSYVAATAAALAVGLAISVGGSGAVSAWLVVTSMMVGGVELLARVAERLRGLSCSDPLTGALNRHGLEREAEVLRADARRQRHEVAVVAIDIEGFKTINDRYGHAAGDVTLAELVVAWQHQLRPRDVLCRYGGDEFVLLLPDTDVEGARTLLRRLRRVSHVPWTAGVASLDPQEDLHDAIRRADHEMYRQRLVVRAR